MMRITRLRRSWVLAIATGIAASLSTTNHAATLAAEQEGSIERAARWQPYCGIYCVYAALRMFGRPVRFECLLRPAYLESAKGSSMKNLRRAIQDVGLHAKALGGMTTQTLQHCPHMTILHVRSSLTSREYTHFVLCYGVEEKGVKVLDPPYSTRFIHFQELAALWDGKAIVISEAPVSSQLLFTPERIGWVISVVVILCIVLAIRIGIGRCHILKGRPSPWVSSVGFSFFQALILCVLVLFGAPLFHLLQDQGLLANGAVVRAIQESHAGDFIPKIDGRVMHRLLTTNAAIFVDARYSRDFDTGHLEGAISVPVNATDEERGKILANVAISTKIVVYCQSAGCPFAKKVAVKLKDDGFSDVAIYRGGWVDWVAKNGTKDTKGES